VKAGGIVALFLGIILAVPILLAAGFEAAFALRGPASAESALLRFDMTTTSDWAVATFEQKTLEPFPVGLEVSATRPYGTGDAPRGEGSLEIEIVDPSGAVAYRNETPVDSLGWRGTLITTGVTEVHPRRTGTWTIRGRVVRSDAAFEGSAVEVFVRRRSRMEGGNPVRNVLIAGGGFFGIARPLVLLLAGTSLLIGSRRARKDANASTT
jgi:hypothetical protein